MNLLETMRIYVMVVERRSIVDAAKDLDLALPDATDRIARLEAYLGCRLLRRDARDAECTPDGVAFYECSRKTLNAVERAMADGQGAGGAMRGASPRYVGGASAPQSLKRVGSGYPSADRGRVPNDRIACPVAERASQALQYQARGLGRREG